MRPDKPVTWVVADRLEAEVVGFELAGERGLRHRRDAPEVLDVGAAGDGSGGGLVLSEGVRSGWAATSSLINSWSGRRAARSLGVRAGAVDFGLSMRVCSSGPCSRSLQRRGGFLNRLTPH